MTSTTVETATIDGDDIVQIRSYRLLRQIARDWQTFSNDALGRIQIPAEDRTRSFRQYPIEADPPAHTAYRALIQKVFEQPHDPGFRGRITGLVDDMVAAALAAGEIEIVRDFALPLQSRALALLLGMPMNEAEIWIDWGVHAFRTESGHDLERAQHLVAYIADRLDRAPQQWPESLFAYLRGAKLDDRPLPADMQMGFAHLVFAGGRDTVIRLISGGIAYLAQNPDVFFQIKRDPSLAKTLTEELVRYLSPLPYLGRICRHATKIDGVPVAAGQRVALCFGAANRDAEAFSQPDRLIPDRRPNPHVGFGSGAHNCPGSAHARLLSRTVLQSLANQANRIWLTSDQAPGLDFSSLEVRLA